MLSVWYPELHLLWVTVLWLSFLACFTMRLQAVTYNPMSLNNDRLSIVLSEFKGFNVVFLNGTSKRSFDITVTPYHTEGYTVIDFGFKSKSQFSNKCCGCIIALRTSCFRNISRIYEPDDSIAGRCGAVRCIRPDIDALFIVWYFPSDPYHPKSKAATNKICEWIRKIVSKVPKRCHIFFGCDANAKLGHDNAGLCFEPHVGPICPSKEDTNGVILRELLVDLELTAVNTHYNTGPTYYGRKSNSRIDYIGCCTSLFTRGKISKCITLERSGDRLQKIRTYAKADHRPVAMYCECALEFSPSPTHDSVLCPDLMMLAIQDKFRNQDFLDHIENWARETMNDEQWVNFRDSSNTTSLWDFFNKKIKDSALLFFSKASAPPNPNKDCKEQKASLFELIKEDTEQLVNSTHLSKSSGIKQIFRLWMHLTKLNRINKSLKKINEKLRNSRKKHNFNKIYFGPGNTKTLHTCGLPVNSLQERKL